MERFVAVVWRVMECIVFGIWRFIAWTVGGLALGWLLSSCVGSTFGGVYYDWAVVVALTGAALGFIGRLVIEVVFLIWPRTRGQQVACHEK